MCGIVCVVSAAGLGAGGGEAGEAELDAASEALRRRGPDAFGVARVKIDGAGVALTLAQATLRLRGGGGGGAGLEAPSYPLAGVEGSALLYNGEVFGGVEVDEERGDGVAVLRALDAAAAAPRPGDGTAIVAALAALRGPWALVYYCAQSRTLYFGRDVYGRRSLQMRRPARSASGPRPELGARGPALVLSSVAFGAETDAWEEVPPGVYRCRVGVGLGSAAGGERTPADMRGLERLEWPEGSVPRTLAAHRRADGTAFASAPEDVEMVVAGRKAAAGDALEYLRRAVRARCARATLGAHAHAPASSVVAGTRGGTSERARPGACGGAGSGEEPSPALPAAGVAVLFSGGVDSALVARLAADEVPAGLAIELVTVCFAGGSSPDRLSAREGAAELARACPSREFRLVEVDSTLDAVDAAEARLRAALYPCRTHMDYNIGAALWTAASCAGACTIYRDGAVHPLPGEYHGRAKVVLLGGGADEQCCGYSRHRTKHREGGPGALERECALDMQRLWSRNCGRDDRLMADRSRECRSPFLDEDFVCAMLAHPVWAIADLSRPPGEGDKACLRAIARQLGLPKAAARVKRAVHFGTRIAKQRNVRDFGSNKAANKAHGGTVVIDSPVAERV